MGIWIVLTLGIAVIFAVLLFVKGAGQAGVLGAALILGGAATLWLTDPLWFPAMKFDGLGKGDLAMLALIAGQGALALAALLRAGGLGGIRASLRRFGLLRILIFFALLGLFAVSVQGYWGRTTAYILHLGVEGGIAVVAVLTCTAMVVLTPAHIRIPRITPFALASVTFLASLALGFYAFEGLPHVEDELAYVQQARGFASGVVSFSAPPEAAQAALEYYLLDIADGRWFSTTPPGWPLVLALGELTGLSLLINPLLAALSVLLFHAIVARGIDRDTSDMATLFFATSPWLLAMAGSLMTHSLSLFLILLAWWLLSQPAPTRGRAMGLALLAGLALGWLFTTRQMDGLIVGVLTGLWLLRCGAVAGLTRAVPYGLGCVATGAIYLIHNAALTGAPLVSPLARYTSELWGAGANGFGFGPDIGPPAGAWGNLDLFAGHTPLEGLIYTANNIASLDFEMFGWPIGALALIWIMLLWGRWTRLDLAMGLLIATVVGIHGLYWFAGSFYIGPRYWFLAFPALAILSASGYRALGARLGAAYGSGLRLTGVTLCLFGLVIFTSWIGSTRYFELRDRNSDLIESVDLEALGHALVFVRSQSDIGPAFMLNDMTLPEGRPIFVRDQGAALNAAVAAAFPGRSEVLIETR